MKTNLDITILVLAIGTLIAVTACGEPRQVKCTNVEAIFNEYGDQPVNAPLNWEEGRHCIEMRVDEVTGEGARGYKIKQNRPGMEPWPR